MCRLVPSKARGGASEAVISRWVEVVGQSVRSRAASIQRDPQGSPPSFRHSVRVVSKERQSAAFQSKKFAGEAALSGEGAGRAPGGRGWWSVPRPATCVWSVGRSGNSPHGRAINQSVGPTVRESFAWCTCTAGRSLGLSGSPTPWRWSFSAFLPLPSECVCTGRAPHAPQSGSCMCFYSVAGDGDDEVHA